MNQAGAIKQRKTFPTGQRVFTKRDSQLQRLLEKLLLSIEFRPKFLQDHDRAGTQLSQTCSKVQFGEKNNKYLAHMIHQLIPKL